jgi:chemotaxis protein methyltransferase CheR
MNEADYGLLKRKMRQQISIDLENYKANQMMRRLDGFISRSGVSGVIQYCSLLEKNSEEREKLRNFLTINVSEFYRDMKHFDFLRTAILPGLLKQNSHLNIWSAGCSDGQEPYTIAILLAELSRYSKHRMLATDIDIVSINKAMAGGPYRPAEIKSLPQTLRAKYLKLEDDNYRVTDHIRSKIQATQFDAGPV